jgi:hypothetical protein
MNLNYARALQCITALVAALATVPALASDLTWPPKLPGGKASVSDTSPDFLKSPASLLPGVTVAKTAPRVDMLYYPEQDYPGSPWSVWGDSLAVGDKYYSAIGDHAAPQGNGFVYEYDSTTGKLVTLVNTTDILHLPEGHYMPGKIHSRIDMGSDGWLYYATHRGSTRVTTDKYHYKGDWIFRTHPETRKTEIVAHGPVPKHCIPTSLLDPDRLIFYGGTAAGEYSDKTVMFFAYDVRKKKVLHTAVNGPRRYIIFARSTGRMYYMDEVNNRLMRYDPESGKPPQVIPGTIGLRAASEETADGYVYTTGQKDGRIWRFNTKTEKIEDIAELPVASQTYTTTFDLDPTGRYLYYIPGAHGGSERDGTPVVQFDTQKRTRKVIAFLQPFYEKKYGYVTLGTFGSAVSPDGSKVYVTWNGNRGGKDPRRGRYAFDTCALTVIHVPESERK